jgi:sulfite exporter TauE/SafE
MNPALKGEGNSLSGRFLSFAVVGANTQSAPVVTAHLAEIAILARMLFGAFLLYFGNENLSRYTWHFNKWHG